VRYFIWLRYTAIGIGEKKCSLLFAFGEVFVPEERASDWGGEGEPQPGQQGWRLGSGGRLCE
jgi:hypothetical protein